MLVLACEKCGHRLKFDAFKCPNCGSTKTSNLKWFLLGSISLLFCVGLFIRISHFSYENTLRKNVSLEYTLNNLIFGVAFTPDFTIKNENDVPIKYITIQCDELDSDESLIDSMQNTITDTIPAHKAKNFQEVYMGNIGNPASITCKIISVKN